MSFSTKLLFLIAIAVACAIGGYFKGYNDHRNKVLKEEIKIVKEISEKKDKVIEITADYSEKQNVILKESHDVQNELQNFEVALRNSYERQYQRLRDSCETRLLNSSIASSIQAEKRIADLRADMSVELSRQAAEYATELDDSRARGMSCEKTYDTFVKKQ